MTQRRKKILLAVLGFLVLAFGGDWLWSVATEPIESLRHKRKTLEKDIEQRSLQLARARKAERELTALSKASLPADPQVARSVYQAWLLERIRLARLTNPAVDSTQPADKNGYYSITFSVQARGTLDKWTRFLYDFYHTDLLHQIRSASFTPTGKKDQLDLVLSIEALVLPSEEGTNKLNDQASDRLAFAKLMDYQPIVLRNLFGVTESPNLTDQMYLTAIQYVNGVPQAWFTQRAEIDPARAVLKLSQGQSLTIGLFTAHVVEIADSDVVLESQGERWLVAIGQNLSQAFALPPEF